MGVGAFGETTGPQIAEATPINVSLPGGLTASHILRNSKGEIGYRLIWQGEVINWFPQREKEEIQLEF